MDPTPRPIRCSTPLAQWPISLAAARIDDAGHLGLGSTHHAVGARPRRAPVAVGCADAHGTSYRREALAELSYLEKAIDTPAAPDTPCRACPRPKRTALAGWQRETVASLSGEGGPIPPRTCRTRGWMTKPVFLRRERIPPSALASTDELRRVGARGGTPMDQATMYVLDHPWLLGSCPRLLVWWLLPPYREQTRRCAFPSRDITRAEGIGRRKLGRAACKPAPKDPGTDLLASGTDGARRPQLSSPPDREDRAAARSHGSPATFPNRWNARLQRSAG